MINGQKSKARVDYGTKLMEDLIKHINFQDKETIEKLKSIQSLLYHKEEYKTGLL